MPLLSNNKCAFMALFTLLQQLSQSDGELKANAETIDSILSEALAQVGPHQSVRYLVETYRRIRIEMRKARLLPCISSDFLSITTLHLN